MNWEVRKCYMIGGRGGARELAEEVCGWLLVSLHLLFGLCLISMMPWGDLGLDARARACTHTHTHTHTLY